jgi:hypothetical protein
MVIRLLLGAALLFLVVAGGPTSAIRHQARWGTALPDCARGRGGPQST